MEDKLLIELSASKDEAQSRMLERLMAYMEALDRYIRVRDVDKEILSDLIVKAKGPRRSVSQFAKEIGVSPSTLTRIINMQTSGASKDELIVKIAAAADPDSGVTLEKLLEAHGVEECSESFNESYRKNEKRMRQIILDELLIRGYAVSNVQAEDNRMYDLIVDTNAVSGGKTGKWAFEFKTYKTEMPITGIGNTARWIDQMMARFYRGEAGVDKISLVVERKEIYLQTIERLKDYTIPDEMSVILISGGHVKSEFIVPMRDRSEKSIFV